MATPKDLPRDIGGFIRDLRQGARISLRQLAEQTGVSNPYLSQIERGLRKPSAEVLQQLASALRVSTPAMYLRAGLLDGEGQQGVLAAVAADPELTIAQKQSLSQIYETFRGENARHAATAADAAGAVPDATAESAAPESARLESARLESARLESAAPQAAGSQPSFPVPQPKAAVVPPDEAARQSAALLDSVAALENGATPAPKTTAKKTTAKPAKKATSKAATKAAETAQEEKS